MTAIRDEHRQRTAQVIALTAATRAAGQAAELAFAAALWAFVTIEEES